MHLPKIAQKVKTAVPYLASAIFHEKQYFKYTQIHINTLHCILNMIILIVIDIVFVVLNCSFD